jgi:glutaredoxin-like protein NrdH
MKATLLTKPNCPHCQALKMFLKHAMNDAYANDIEILDLESHEAEVENLLKKHNIQSFPSMIANDDVMVGFLPSKLMNFLEKHIGKK